MDSGVRPTLADLVTVAGTVIVVAALAAFPVLMFRGHGRGLDWAARVGDTVLGVIWILFVWSVLGNVASLGLLVAGVGRPESFADRRAGRRPPSRSC